jgi:hypothetical protein
MKRRSFLAWLGFAPLASVLPIEVPREEDMELWNAPTLSDRMTPEEYTAWWGQHWRRDLKRYAARVRFLEAARCGEVRTHQTLLGTVSE